MFPVCSSRTLFISSTSWGTVKTWSVKPGYESTALRTFELQVGDPDVHRVTGKEGNRVTGLFGRREYTVNCGNRNPLSHLLQY
jgi:hypothetical protein